MKIIEQRVFGNHDEGETYMEDLACRLRAGGYLGKFKVDIEFMDAGRVSFTLRGSKPVAGADEE